MTCRDLIEFLIDYLSGNLSEEDRALFEAHLAECPPCVAYLRTYLETLQLERVLCMDFNELLCATFPEDLVQAILVAREKS